MIAKNFEIILLVRYFGESKQFGLHPLEFVGSDVEFEKPFRFSLIPAWLASKIVCFLGPSIRPAVVSQCSTIRISAIDLVQMHLS